MCWRRSKLVWAAADADRRAFALGYALLLPYFLAPLLVARFLPGLDLPFHLSMADMLNKGGRSDSPYAAYYQGTLAPVPYAAYYLALRGLSWALPLMTAHKVVIGMYVAGFPLAAASLLRACGRSSIPALLVFPLAYNLTLHYGFVSFALSLPVVLLLLAQLTKLLTSARLSVTSFVTTAASAVLLYLCHLQNFLYGLCAAVAFVVLSGMPWRRRLVGAASLLPSVAMLLFWHLTTTFEGDTTGQRKSIAFAWNTFKQQVSSEAGKTPLWSLARDRIFELLPVHLLRGFTDRSDVAASKRLLVVIGLYVVVGLLALLLRRPTAIRPRMRLAGAVAFAGAVLAYGGLPHHLPAFELMTFYPRFSVLLVMMALLMIPAGLRRLPPHLLYVAVLPAVLVCGRYGVDLVRNYGQYDREMAEFDAVVRKAEPGRKALGLVFDRYSRVMRVESSLVGTANLYAVVRPAPGSMVTLSYCGMRHIPCHHVGDAHAMPDPGVWSPAALDPVRAVDFFDYFFVRSPPPGRSLFGSAASRVELVAHDGSWWLYRRKPAAAAPPRAR